MNIWNHAVAGLAVACGGWLIPRAVAGAHRYRWRGLWLDAFLPLTVFLLLAALTARPLFAGAISCAMGAGFSYADRAKRRVLAEPVVFTDVFQAFDIFRHPKLALPFPHLGRVLCIVAAAGGLFFAAFRAEPAAWPWSPWIALLPPSLLLVAGWACGGPFNVAAGRALRKLRPVGDPLRDGAELGPFATLLAYAIIARAERAQRQSSAPASAGSSAARRYGAAKVPLVLVQCESFFDARRLHPDLAGLPFAEFDRCRRAAVQWGRLAVPSWGANTVRTEFSVLSGVPPQTLGFDRFNPYHRFARAPVSSLAWRMRAEGYRTVCLHPFDRSFYGRDRVLPNLGFDAFIGEEAFAGAQRINGYVADIEVARMAGEILRQERGRVFLFVITMENHGPWPAPAAGSTVLLPAALQLPDSERSALERYLQSLQNADRMLGHLAEELEELKAGGVMAFYGDHLPSFPGSFEQLGLRDLRSDYLVWRSGAAARAGGRIGQHLDIEAHDLGAAILRAHGPLQAASTVPRLVRGGA